MVPAESPKHHTHALSFTVFHVTGAGSREGNQIHAVASSGNDADPVFTFFKRLQRAGRWNCSADHIQEFIERVTNDWMNKGVHTI